MVKVKITVVKKVNNKDMFGDNPPLGFTIAPECDRLELGKEFISEGGCPEGFCAWAFAQIRYGGSYRGADQLRDRLHSPKNTPCIEDSLIITNIRYNLENIQPFYLESHSRDFRIS